MIPIILASSSARRRELFALLDLPFEIITADVDETPRPNEAPDVLVARLSATKAAAVAGDRESGLVVAADTVVVLDDEILCKPNDPDHARQMLRRLGNREHMVHSGVTVAEAASGRATIQLSTTAVWMRNYSDDEIEAYVASGDPMDKAGAYAVQHREFRPTTRVEGCFTGVVGLPLGALADGLAHFDVVPPVTIATVCQQWTGHPCCRA